MPHFSLAWATRRLLMSRRISVIGMHLDREFVSGENKLNQDWEIFAIAKPFAAPAFGKFFPCGAECLSGEWSRGNFAVEARQPGFTQRLLQVCFLREKRSERARAPNARTENRLKTKRLGTGGPGTHTQAAASARAKNFSSRRSPSSMRSMEVAYESRK